MIGRSQPRQQRNSQPGGYPRRDRDSERAYHHNMRRQPRPENWSDEVDQYREYQRPENNEEAAQRNKQRMQEFKKKKIQEKKNTQTR